MKAKEIKREARQRVAAMLEQIAAHGGRVDAVALSDYADAETFEFITVRPGWTFEEWRAVNQEAARLIEARGVAVRFVKVTLDDYFEFLARYDLKNTPANRAQFVGWLTCPEPRPAPMRD